MPDPSDHSFHPSGFVTNPSLGIGLQGVSDSTTQQPFLDVFKTARQWEGHIPGQYGGIGFSALQAAGLLDVNGWPVDIPETVIVDGQSIALSHIGTVLLTEMPAEMTSAAGRYRITYDGTGDIWLNGAENVTYAAGEIWFDYVPDGSRAVFLDIFDTTPGDHIRNIRVVHENHIPRLEAGEVFNPAWIDLIKDMRSLRFMDWMRTNNSDQAEWGDRPTLETYTWGAGGGVPLETMIALANLTGTDPWFTLPHQASAAYVEAFVTMVRDHLDPDLKAYFEYSNEVWNWQFDQAQWAHSEGQSRWPGQGDAWIQWQALKATEMSAIVAQVYGAELEARAIRVISTQTGWRGLEDPLLNAPNWVAENPATNPRPYTQFDAYGVTGYFDGALGRDEKVDITRQWLATSLTLAEDAATRLGLSGTARASYIADHRFDHAQQLAIAEMRDGSVTGNPAGSLAELFGTFAYHAQIAAAYGLQLVMYEGGTHLVGVGANANDPALTEFFIHVNHSPEMAQLYQELLAGWRTAGGTLFNAFVDVGSPGWWGSWGHMQHLDDLDSPRWGALRDFNTANPGWWEIRAPTAFGQADPLGVHQTGTDSDEGLTGTAADDRLSGVGGNDSLDGLAGADRLIGGAGDDTLLGGDGNDSLWGQLGQDQLFGGDGDDLIDAGPGEDFGGGGAGNDTIRGGDGADSLWGGLGDDSIEGGAGNDRLFGSAGQNTISGGSGNDTIQGGSANDMIQGDDGHDELFGNAGHDLIDAGTGADFVGGGAGDDTIRGGDGSDTLWAGLGNDNLGGGPGDDIIYGSAGDNLIWGGLGNDTIYAGTGRDVLHGGPGADVFVFASAAHFGIGSGRDMIADFTSGVDSIDLRALGTSFNGVNGFLGAGASSFYWYASGGLLIGDLNGDARADWVIALNSQTAVSAGDFLL